MTNDNELKDPRSYVSVFHPFPRNQNPLTTGSCDNTWKPSLPFPALRIKLLHELLKSRRHLGLSTLYTLSHKDPFLETIGVLKSPTQVC